MDWGFDAADDELSSVSDGEAYVMAQTQGMSCMSQIPATQVQLSAMTGVSTCSQQVVASVDGPQRRRLLRRSDTQQQRSVRRPASGPRSVTPTAYSLSCGSDDFLRSDGEQAGSRGESGTGTDPVSDPASDSESSDLVHTLSQERGSQSRSSVPIPSVEEVSGRSVSQRTAGRRAVTIVLSSASESESGSEGEGEGDMGHDNPMVGSASPSPSPSPSPFASELDDDGGRAPFSDDPIESEGESDSAWDASDQGAEIAYADAGADVVEQMHRRVPRRQAKQATQSREQSHVASLEGTQGQRQVSDVDGDIVADGLGEESMEEAPPAETGTPYIMEVSLENFKTFSGPHRVSLRRGLISIIGQNGLGKSNMLDAVLFALGAPKSYLRCKVFSQLICHGASSMGVSIRVGCGSDSEGAQERVFSRSVSVAAPDGAGDSASQPASTPASSTTSYRVDGRTVSLSAYTEALDQLHLSATKAPARLAVTQNRQDIEALLGHAEASLGVGFLPGLLKAVRAAAETTDTHCKTARAEAAGVEAQCQALVPEALRGVALIAREREARGVLESRRSEYDGAVVKGREILTRRVQAAKTDVDAAKAALDEGTAALSAVRGEHSVAGAALDSACVATGAHRLRVQATDRKARELAQAVSSTTRALAGVEASLGGCREDLAAEAERGELAELDRERAVASVGGEVSQAEADLGEARQAVDSKRHRLTEVRRDVKGLQTPIVVSERPGRQANPSSRKASGPPPLYRDLLGLGALGAVCDLVKCQRGSGCAVNAVLGGMATACLVPDTPTAVRVVEVLRGRRKGQVTVLVLDRMRREYQGDPQTAREARLANSLSSCLVPLTPEVEPLRHLLRGWRLASTDTEALSLAGRGTSAVTRRGAVFRSDGEVSARSAPQAGKAQRTAVQEVGTGEGEGSAASQTVAPDQTEIEERDREREQEREREKERERERKVSLSAARAEEADLVAAVRDAVQNRSRLTSLLRRLQDKLARLHAPSTSHLTELRSRVHALGEEAASLRARLERDTAALATEEALAAKRREGLKVLVAAETQARDALAAVAEREDMVAKEVDGLRVALSLTSRALDRAKRALAAYTTLHGSAPEVSCVMGTDGTPLVEHEMEGRWAGYEDAVQCVQGVGDSSPEAGASQGSSGDSDDETSESGTESGEDAVLSDSDSASCQDVTDTGADESQGMSVCAEGPDPVAAAAESKGRLEAACSLYSEMLSHVAASTGDLGALLRHHRLTATLASLTLSADALSRSLKVARARVRDVAEFRLRVLSACAATWSTAASRVFGALIPSGSVLISPPAPTVRYASASPGAQGLQVQVRVGGVWGSEAGLSGGQRAALGLALMLGVASVVVESEALPALCVTQQEMEGRVPSDMYIDGDTGTTVCTQDGGEDDPTEEAIEAESVDCRTLVADAQLHIPPLLLLDEFDLSLDANAAQTAAGLLHTAVCVSAPTADGGRGTAQPGIIRQRSQVIAVSHRRWVPRYSMRCVGVCKGELGVATQVVDNTPLLMT
ncbi:hypothetical protein KIPB_006325 [Kipferlia bialata]|uniref:SMC hinge domain-containing protein n=1 Tax=Kipferlia bialata TaxID=797122 RepID=A0A9K3CYH6_9EUKA|nr:hypothetical protein KIPB_006325 [Kipferlia bialata]|eukprot:g6325.t1